MGSPFNPKLVGQNPNDFESFIRAQEFHTCLPNSAGSFEDDWKGERGTQERHRAIQANFNDKLGALPLFLSAVHETRKAFNNLLRSPNHCGCLLHLPTILLKDSSERVAQSGRGAAADLV